MTGRINDTPEAQQQLSVLADWIREKASRDAAEQFVSAILDYIDGTLVFPLAGRARDDVRPGIRTTTFKKRTLIAYEVEESSGELVVDVLGVFHGGRDRGAALRDDGRPTTAADRWPDAEGLRPCCGPQTVRKKSDRDRLLPTTIVAPESEFL